MRPYPLMLVCAVWPALLTAQVPRLGEPPAAPLQTYPSPAPQADAIASFFDTSSRAAVRDYYNNVYAPLLNTPYGWSGNVLAGNAGDTSQAYKDAVKASINWFRSMAGVPAAITLNSTYNQKDQQAAMMFSANNALSHAPPSNWINWTAAGAEAAANSNICIGCGSTDPGGTRGYIQDAGGGNFAAGHRRWFLYPQTQTMGTGDVPATGNLNSANATWVFDGLFGTARPGTREEFVAWPPKGYVPYQVVFPRWSFSFPGADFANATVVLQRNGSPVPVRLETVIPGYGENSIVFVPDNLDANQFVVPTAPVSDITTNVTINNVLIQGQPRTFSYAVTVFDPATAGVTTIPVTVTTSPGLYNVTVDGVTAPAPQSFNWTPNTTHTIDVPSPQGSATTRQVFGAWNTGGAKFQTLNTPASATTYSATFTTQHLLTRTASPQNGGTLTANPTFVDGFYNAGTSVQLTAAANTGFSFSGFSGALSGATNPRNIVMDATAAVTANFAAVAACSYGLANSSAPFPSAGGSGQIPYVVTGGASCPWTVSSTANWLTLTSSGSGTGNPVVNYSVAPNTSSTSRTGQFVLKDDLIFTVVQSASQIFTNSFFVNQLYLDILNRSPEPNGAGFWTAQLNAGTPRKDVTYQFFSSNEFQGTGFYIIATYIAVLGRDPDFGGWLFWLNALNNGQPRQSIVQSFINSAEFVQTYGSLNNTAFVNLVYQNVLGRAPDTAGLNFWVGQLNGGMTRGDMMYSFVVSAEFASRIQNRALATLLYMGFLRRSPEPAGLAFWTNSLNNGLAGANAIEPFINSVEYLLRF
ncbi:MAG: DUF4214 domain-containing protein [Bryobacteraceae bacterium]